MSRADNAFGGTGNRGWRERKRKLAEIVIDSCFGGNLHMYGVEYYPNHIITPTVTISSTIVIISLSLFIVEKKRSC